MYMNQTQLDNVRRTLLGVEKLASEMQRRLHDKSISKTVVALNELNTLIDYAKEQLK